MQILELIYFYMSKNMWRRLSKLWSVIISQKSLIIDFVIEPPEIRILRQSVSKSSPANNLSLSLSSTLFIPILFYFQISFHCIKWMNEWRIYWKNFFFFESLNLQRVVIYVFILIFLTLPLLVSRIFNSSNGEEVQLWVELFSVWNRTQNPVVSQKL